MTFPPPPPASQSSIASGSKPSGTRSIRPQQSAWGLPAGTSSSRRGLTPLTTNVNPSAFDLNARRSGRSNSPNTNAASASPFASSFSSVLNSGRQPNSRNNSSASSSASPFTAFQSGSQQAQTSQSVSSPRSQSNTPSSNPNLASSAAASATVIQGGGGSGGGGGSNAPAFSPSLSQQSLGSPTSSTFDRTSFTPLSTTTPSTNQSSVSKIVVTQVFLLLGSITEKEGKVKWESQAEAIRKLVESNGMEIFPKYFRRILVGNSPQIFPGINRNVENPGNYQLLVEEMEKITLRPDQAQKIAETIDTSDGDIFKDFDLATFMNHFRLEPIAKSLLACAFRQVSRGDLRTKAATILSSNFQSLLQYFANSTEADHEYPPALLATCAFRLLQDLPKNSRNGTEKERISYALKQRYIKQDIPFPTEIRSALVLVDLLDSGNELATDLQRQGPRATATVESTKDFYAHRTDKDIPTEQIAGALLFMVLTLDWEQYRPAIFVAATRELFKINWQNVVEAFDRNGLNISKDQFIVLYNALLPIAEDDTEFDIQSLWGGKWRHPSTQLSFVLAFTSLLPSQLDATTIPGLRRAYDPTECNDGPEEVVQYIEEARRNTMISLEAITAIMELVWDTTTPPSAEDTEAARRVIEAEVGLFLCAAAGIPQPWTAIQQSVMAKMLKPYIFKQQADYNYVLHSLWKQDRNWFASRLIETHSEDPLQLTLILEHAQEHGWLADLLTMINGFGLDLAALAHRKGCIDLDDWAQDKLARGPTEFALALTKFLVIKAQDEMRTVRGEQPAPRTVSLAMKTVFAMLLIVEEYLKDRPDEIIPLERACMQAFPRLINYGEGFDDLLESMGEESNALSQSTDAEMQELYKRMYSQELGVRELIEHLRECKTSKEPERQDLFSCMIHGLFDEYVCFNDYPLSPLATTAVLFGGIINYGLISNLTLNVSLEMVLEAVRQYSPQSSMFKFGLQALIHFLNRLVEWPEFCRKLLQVPELQGTEAYNKAEAVLHETEVRVDNSTDKEGMNGLGDGAGLTNGNIDEFLTADTTVQSFRSVHAELPSHQDFYEDPEEDVQDKVLFVLNNVSENNLSTKLYDLVEVLDVRYHQWFAAYLVEERAKFQPNYQHLYLDLLDGLNDKRLWDEILRETFVSVRKILSAESTMKNAVDRTHLKNLATWLGSLTIARDKPIKHKNIAFKELLIEGYESQRMIIVVPFTCEVLQQGRKSVVFKPPNPWFMEIVHLLLELYDTPDIKINQKFAIELLCTEFGLDSKKTPRSEELQNRQQMLEDALAGPMMSETVDGFDDLAIGSINRGVRNARFSPATIASSIPELEPLLVFPPSSGTMVNQNHLRQIVQNAVRRAILEIIAPVVERSVTIATIATSNLIHKDFAREPDEDRVRGASQTMARTLSGSLALVTCKEPLRMSMSNYIRMAQNDLSEQAFPEGAILMCVNDNLDTACHIVEKQAEERSMPEIESHIENEIAQRRQHRADYPNEPYRDPTYSHWSSYIPEPYKQVPGGLNQEQLDIYLQFARESRGLANHVQASSTDSGRQIPDVLQEGFPPVPNLSTPAEPPALPHQPTHAHGQIGQGATSSIGQRAQGQPNGYMDAGSIQDHIVELMTELSRLAKEAPEKHFKELPRESPLMDVIAQIQHLTLSSSPNPDGVAMLAASAICSSLYATATDTLEVEVLVRLLGKLCQISMATAKEVMLLFRNQEDEKALNVAVTVPLMEAGLIEFGQVDMALARAMQQRNYNAIDCLSEIMDALLFTQQPVAFRADFAASLGAMGQLLAEEPDLTAAKSLMSRLKAAGIPESANLLNDDQILKKQQQIHYIFSEWVHMCQHPEENDGMFVAFVTQLHYNKMLNTSEDVLLFLRLCIDVSVEALEQEELTIGQESSEIYFSIDALTRLIVVMVRSQGETNGARKPTKPAYMKSILSLIVLVVNNHHVMRGERFNQRYFFRLFSSLLCDWYDLMRDGTFEDQEMVLVFADTFLQLEPHYFPAFTYGWLSLVSHRVFMPTVLKLTGDECCEPFAKIMEAMLSYMGELLRPPPVAGVAKELYRGVLRILLMLHHDFPEFLAENHYRFCNIIPAHCTQLRNLVLSAYPSSFPELPDPFTAGLKVDRLEEIRKAPVVAGDTLTPLLRGNVKEIIDKILRSADIPDDNVNQITEAAYTSDRGAVVLHQFKEVDPIMLHAIVLYIGQSAISAGGGKGGPSFSANSPQAHLMSKIAKELHPEARYYFLSAIANQLRYPNSHTHYFSYALLHLFGSDLADQQESDVRQQITRVLLERLIVHRPHPWGLIITLLELLKNPTYMFWDLPFIKAAPEIERLFGALFQHINQSPRTLT